MGVASNEHEVYITFMAGRAGVLGARPGRDANCT
jgi:hypothetical protein